MFRNLFNCRLLRLFTTLYNHSLTLTRLCSNYKPVLTITTIIDQYQPLLTIISRCRALLTIIVEDCCTTINHNSINIRAPLLASRFFYLLRHHAQPPPRRLPEVYRFEWSTEGSGQLTFFMDGKLLYRLRQRQRCIMVGCWAE